MTTGMVLLAFLNGGDTLRTGTHRAPIEAATRWLGQQQDDSGALFAHDRMAQSITTLALVHAYGLSRSPGLEACTQRAVAALQAKRTKAGGWSGPDGDPAPTPWAVEALRAAAIYGLAIDDAGFDEARAWLDARADQDPRLHSRQAVARRLIGDGDFAAAMKGRVLPVVHPTDPRATRVTTWMVASRVMGDHVRKQKLPATVKTMVDVGTGEDADVQATALLILEHQWQIRRCAPRR